MEKGTFNITVTACGDRDQALVIKAIKSGRLTPSDRLLLHAFFSERLSRHDGSPESVAREVNTKLQDAESPYLVRLEGPFAAPTASSYRKQFYVLKFASVAGTVMDVTGTDLKMHVSVGFSNAHPGHVNGGVPIA